MNLKEVRPLGAAFVGLTILLGVAWIVTSFVRWSCADPLRFGVYLAGAILSAGWHVRIPGRTAAISPNFIYVFLGLMELSSGEIVTVASVSVIAQHAWMGRTTLDVGRSLFHICAVTLATGLSWTALHLTEGLNLPWATAVSMIPAACIYFAVNSGLAAFGNAWLEGKSGVSAWRASYRWHFPYYMGGALLAAGLGTINLRAGWWASMLILPSSYLIYRVSRHHIEALEDGKRAAELHGQEVERESTLRLRTIEVLTEAIEMKHQKQPVTNHRLRIYCEEIANDLGVTGDDLRALQAAVLLHDVGKLAVPEGILAKPGRLSREELAKVKIHPLVGAEIVERIGFPYAVMPIVRHHHEKWDGSGYPDGLSGDEIPLGARILAAVDSLDALTSERPYRRAYPIDEAIKLLIRERGKSFDPDVVLTIERRFQAYEEKVRATVSECAPLPVGMEVGASGAPEQTPGTEVPAEARERIHALLVRERGLEPLIAGMGEELRKSAPFDTLVVYRLSGNVLKAEYAAGKDEKLFRALAVPLGEGLCGWVAAKRQPIVNGNPAVEPGYLKDRSRVTVLRSAVAVPLVDRDDVIGVVALYSETRDAFEDWHVDLLNLPSAMLGELMGDRRRSEVKAAGLPDSRSFHRQLALEAERCRNEQVRLGVVLCSIEGNEAGPAIMEGFATKVQEQMRWQCYVAQVGSGEFGMVIPGATTGLGGMLEKTAQTAGATMRIGWAVTHAGTREPFELIAAAARNLRNRVAVEGSAEGLMSLLHAVRQAAIAPKTAVASD